MLAIEVELLTGRYAATAHDDRRRAEWPPHPARFFSALVAALHDREPVDTDEREALLWLERQPPPAIDVDLDVYEIDGEELGLRKVHDVFVPVNDVSVSGDPWPLARAVEAAEAALTEARSAEDPKVRAKLTNKAAKRLADARKKLDAKTIAPSAKPSKTDLDAARALLPEARTKQARTFPTAIPHDSTFVWIWDAEPTADLRKALDSLCGRVTRLGHSSSLVRCSVTDRAITPTLLPTREGDIVLRVVGEGQLDRLEREFERHQATKHRVLPARPQRYRRASDPSASEREPVESSVFTGDWILFERRGGARLLSSRSADLSRALRNAVLEANGLGDPLPAVLSGHEADGSRTERPHVAFVACPFVGYPHADGSIQGCAIVLPRDTSDDDRERLLRLLAAWENRAAPHRLVEVAGEGLPPVQLERVLVTEKDSLAPERWSRAATRFVTATPIALHRHPGNLRSNREGTAARAAREAAQTIAEACQHIGLPRPVSVEVSLAPLLSGAQPVLAFRPWPDRPGRFARARVHAEIRFEKPVRGPVLLGAGRYFGLGLCLPVPERRLS